jgi:hypothetical protein
VPALRGLAQLLGQPGKDVALHVAGRAVAEHPDGVVPVLVRLVDPLLVADPLGDLDHARRGARCTVRAFGRLGGDPLALERHGQRDGLAEPLGHLHSLGGQRNPVLERRVVPPRRRQPSQ